jgi:hypothetical protein
MMVWEVGIGLVTRSLLFADGRVLCQFWCGSKSLKRPSHIQIRMPTRRVGVKGSDVYDSTGDARVDLSVRMVRGADAADLKARIQEVARNHLADAAVMAFHARNVRGGKGERDVGLTLLRGLYESHPELVLNLLDLVPHYGCWRDLRDVSLTGVHGETMDDKIESIQATIRLDDRIIGLIADQLRADADTPEGKSISLCAKWAPRERDGFAREVAAALFPEEKRYSSLMKRYRKLVSGLNKRLETVETRMCANTWTDIKPAHVPGRAGRVYRRAFLNLVPNGPHGRPAGGRDPNDVRCPHSEDRKTCAATFEAFYEAAKSGKATVKGADTVFPHEVVKQAVPLMRAADSNENDKAYLSGVWRAMVDKARAAGGLGRSIFMCDFSGSMQSTAQGDTPYWVSMALGILGSQVVDGAFKGKMLTFDSTPTWHQFPVSNDGAPTDLFDCIRTIGNIGHGLSTDFQAAMDLVLATLKRERVAPGQEPENIIVLTDMNWDQASASNGQGAYTGNSYRHHVKTAEWQTHLEMIQESFRRASEDIHGDANAWAVPRIVVWNLASNPTDFHAQADTPGVGMLSGWSPTQFKVLLADGPRAVTPLEMLRLELDDPRYDQIRQRVGAMLASKGGATNVEVGGDGHHNGWGFPDA